MVRKCVYLNCTSTSTFPDRLFNGIYFISFPKPDQQPEKCSRWIKLCGGPNDNLNVKAIDRNTYVCSKHFVGGRGPTERYPDPLPADTTAEDQTKLAQKASKKIQPQPTAVGLQEILLTATNNNVIRETSEISIQTDEHWISEQQLIADVGELKKQMNISIVSNSKRQRESVYLIREVGKIKKQLQPYRTCCCYNDKTRSSKEIFSDFIQNTSLQGIRQALRERSLIWLCAYIACLTMCILQSWNVAVDYIAGKTVQSSFLNVSRLLPFPSVTACSGIVLPADFDVSRIPGFNLALKKAGLCAADSSGKKEEYQNNEDKLSRYIRTLNETERLELGVKIEKEFVQYCTYNGHSCNFSDPDEIHIFNNPMLGNCFTFNPGFNIARAKQSFANTKLVLSLSANGFRLEQESNLVAVLIHQPGSAPVLDSEKVRYGQLGEYLDLRIKLQAEIAVKRSWPSFISCVEVTDENYQKKRENVFYSKSSPYLYSFEACMKSCEQLLYYKTCKVLNPFTPITPLINEENATFVLPPIDCAADELELKTCDCPFPCKSYDYDVTSDNIETSNSKCNDDSSQNNNKEILGVTVRFLSNIYETKEEHVKYSIYEFLGILGGNFSLWIGFCVISLLEVFDVGLKLFCLCFRKCCCKSSSQSKKQGVDVLCCCCNCHDTKVGKPMPVNGKSPPRPLSVSSITATHR